MFVNDKLGVETNEIDFQWKFVFLQWSSFIRIAWTIRSSRSVIWSWWRNTACTSTTRSSAADPAPRPASYPPEAFTRAIRRGGAGASWRASSKNTWLLPVSPAMESNYDRACEKLALNLSGVEKGRKREYIYKRRKRRRGRVMIRFEHSSVSSVCAA